MGKKIDDLLFEHESGRSDDPADEYRGKSYVNVTPDTKEGKNKS